MGGKNIQQKNIDYTLRDLQKQIGQLKAKVKTFSKAKGSEYILKCDADGEEFAKYDIVKVTAGNVAEAFTGSEDYSTELLPGIVLGGNVDDNTSDVFVLINGISYVKVSEDVTTGQLLYPYASNYRQGALTGNVGYWKVMEDTSANDYVKVNIIYGTGSGGGEYLGPFKCVEKNSTTITVQGYDVSEEQFFHNNVIIGLEKVENTGDSDVTITNNGVVYAHITGSPSSYSVSYLFATSLPAQTFGNVYVTLANVRFSGGVITEVNQIWDEEIHVAGRIV